MSEALKELASSGTIGAAFVVVLFMLFWMVKVLIASFVKQTEAVIKAMNELVEASRAIRDNCRNCRTDSLQTLRDAQVAIAKTIEDSVARGHDATFREMKELVGESTQTISSALTGTANSIRATNAETLRELEGKRREEENERLREENAELSRPHDLGAVPHPVRG
jgi:hypothetical protein